MLTQSDHAFTIFLATHQPADFSPIEQTAFTYFQRLNGALNQAESSNH